MSRWFTSDLHLGDPWASKMRYCKNDVEKMAFTMALRWDRRITDEDEVFIVGDLARGMPMAEVSQFLSDRPGRKHVVLGNWDREEEILLLPVGAVTPNLVETFEDFAATLSHYPETDAVDGVLIHGHTHKRKKWSIRKDGQINIHVGWDAWQRPVHESEIVKIVRSVRMLEAEKEGGS